MAVTIRDVSARCGLSVSTVSKALNHYADISASTRELVQRTARELGYYPSAIARTLKTNRSRSVGVILETASQPGLCGFHYAILDAFRRECCQFGYDLTFISRRADGMTWLEHCRYRNVDGVCVIRADLGDPEAAELLRGELPVVTVDEVIRQEDAEGLRALLAHAARLGHRRIVCLHGDSAGAESPLSASLRELPRQGLPAPTTQAVAAPDDPQAWAQAIRCVLELPAAPTCLLLPDDLCALTALYVAAEMGLRVPEDVSIASCCGGPVASLTHPRLTALRPDAEALGQQAARRLMERIENPRAAPDVGRQIPAALEPGESLGPAPKDRVRQ